MPPVEKKIYPYRKWMMAAAAVILLSLIHISDLFPRRGATSNAQYGGVDEGDGISNINMEDIAPPMRISVNGSSMTVCPLLVSEMANGLSAGFFCCF